MKKLKLKGANRYSIVAIRKEPFERGETIDVEDRMAVALLKETVRDRANNKWPVWEDVSREDPPTVSEEVAKKTPTRRRRKSKVQVAQTETEE